jgi:hypothetical protein
MTLLSAPKVIPRLFVVPPVTALEEAELAWLGSSNTPEKKPNVTTRAAPRDKNVGYCYTSARKIHANDPAHSHKQHGHNDSEWKDETPCDLVK